MRDPIFYREFMETCADWYDWIDIWLGEGNTKESMLEAFKEMIEEVEEMVEYKGEAIKAEEGERI